MYRLQQAIYGLKQAPRVWYKMLREQLQLELIRFHRTVGGVLTILLCHVDDMLIVSRCRESV